MDVDAVRFLLQCLKGKGIRLLEVQHRGSRINIVMDDDAAAEPVVTGVSHRSHAGKARRDRDVEAAASSRRHGHRARKGGDAAGSGHPATSTVSADAVGRFLVAHPLMARPFVDVGDRVVAGQTLGLLKLGLIYKPVLADRGGTVRRILARNGAGVDWKTPLFEIDID